MLEIGDAFAAAYAGRLFADLGADVVKVERGDGDPLRRTGPFVDGASVPAAYFHAGKRSVGAEAELVWLASRADVVVRATNDGVDWLTDEQLDAARETNPGLIVVDVSTFGRRSGDASMSDLLALAAGGVLLLNTDADGDPLRYRGELASVHAACDGVLASIAALQARLVDGVGQHIDVSAQAAMAAILLSLTVFTYTGDKPVFGGIPAIAPWGFFDCADGTMLLMINEDVQWRGLKRVLGEPDWAAAEIFDTNASRRELFESLNALVASELACWKVDELVDACAAHNVPASKVHTATDVLSWPQLRERGFLTPLCVGNGDATVLAPSMPWRTARQGALVGTRRAPSPGADADAVPETWTVRPQHVDPDAPALAPWDGLRLIDLTWVWAGPYSAMQFAHLGGDVVKFEWEQRIDVTRILNPFAEQIRGINRSGYFNMYSQGKRSISLDITGAEGRSLLKRTIATADAVMDNMRPGALARMGLGPDELAELSPSLVAVGMSGFGESGPERDRMAYGAVIDSLCGTSTSNGRPGGGRTFFPMSMPDPGAGIHAAIATAAAVYRARRTGEGDRIEVSMTEATIAAFPWAVLIESSGNGPVVNVGNRDELMSPHGTFLCAEVPGSAVSAAGHREWLAILARDDAGFAAICRAMGEPDLVSDPRFATLDARKANEDELESLVGAWTRSVSRAEAVAALRAEGAVCEPLADVEDVVTSPVLAARGSFASHEHPEVGTIPVPGPAWITSRSPMQPRAAAPCLGQHTEEVLADLVGLSPGEIADLRARGLLG